MPALRDRPVGLPCLYRSAIGHRRHARIVQSARAAQRHHSLESLEADAACTARRSTAPAPGDAAGRNGRVPHQLLSPRRGLRGPLRCGYFVVG
jgi:hypothetical protein